MSEGKSDLISDTAVAWLSEIPAHWTMHRLRRVVAKFVDYRGRTPEKSDDGIPLITTGAIRNGRIDHSRNPEWVSEKVYEELLTRGMPEVGDLLFTSEAPLGEVAILEDSNVALAQRIILFKVEQSRITSNFLKYHFISDSGKGEIQSRASGSTAEGIRADRLKMSLVPTPPVKEQTPIAQFLDRKTAAIDILIAKKQRLIELLEEKRSALINQAVTKGLNPDAPMKDSGIPWIGEIPNHWDVRRISRISQKITNGFVGATRDILRDEGVPYIQSLHVKFGKILFERRPYYVDLAWSEAHKKSVLQTDDVLIVQTGAETGQCAIVPHEFEGANCHALIIIRTTEDCLGKYLLYLLQSSYGVNALEAIQTGALHEHLNCTLVRDVSLPVPPINEQRQIVQVIDEEMKKFSQLIARTRMSIQALQEYRRSVITAAVTGKLDVTQAVAP